MRMLVGGVVVALCACQHAPVNEAKIEPAEKVPPVVLQGTVTSADGKPVAQANVALIPTDPSNPLVNESKAQALTATDASGHYAFSGVPGATYAVTVAAPDFLAGFVPAVEVKPGVVATKDVALQPGGVEVVVKLVDDDGRPVTNATLAIAKVSDDMGDLFFPAKRGDAYVIRFPDGSFYLNGTSPGRERLYEQFQLQGKPWERTLTLSEPALTQPPAPPEVFEWLKANAIPLDAGDKLVALVGKARVLNLGEATHGTREFFATKHQLFELMAKRAGFNTMAIEATWPETLALNDYVLTGKGDPSELISRMRFWTWDTDEVFAMVKWMREWNKDPKHRRKLEFIGIDMQFAPVAAQLVRDYLQQVDPAKAKQYAAPLELLCSEYQSWARMVGDHTALLKQAEDIRDLFEANKAAWVKKSSPAKWDLAHRAAITVTQSTTHTHGARDEAMADNLLHYLEQRPDAKVVGWMHNYHAAHRADSTGAFLKQKLGADLVTLGFGFDHGDFRAIALNGNEMGALVTHSVKSLPAGTFDATFAQVPLPAFVIDLRTLPKTGPVAAWFSKKHALRAFGAVYRDDGADGDWVLSQVLQQEFDGLIFIAETHAAASRPNAARPADQPAPEPKDLALAGNDGLSGWDASSRTTIAGFEVTRRPGCCVVVSGKRASVVPGYGQTSQYFDAKPFAGKTIRWKGSARGTATARVFLVASGYPEVLIDAPVDGVEPKPFVLEAKISPNAKAIRIGIALDTQGKGEAALGPSSIEVVQ